MPRSKRAKVVHLSKTEKKGKEHTIRLFGLIRASVDKYQHCIVFAVSNMRNTYLKDVRTTFGDSRSVTLPHPPSPFALLLLLLSHLPDGAAAQGPQSDRKAHRRTNMADYSSVATSCRLFFGKTKVMTKALGTSPADEHAPHLSQLAPHLTGDVGLLFTDRVPQTVLAYFATYAPLDYARAGTVAARTFTVPAGTVCSRGGEVAAEEDVPLPHSVEAEVRRLGMPTRLVKGRVELEGKYTVCREGEVLSSAQTALLKTFGVAMAEFRIEVKAYWSAATQEVTEIGGMDGVRS